jgi:hypothetical protein
MPEPEGVALAYLKLTKTGISNTQMERAEVYFQVPVSWLREKDINQFKVYLRRDAVTYWEALETTYLSEDGEFAYYKAVTPGFSYFVITGEAGSGYVAPEVGGEAGEVQESQTPDIPPAAEPLSPAPPSQGSGEPSPIPGEGEKVTGETLEEVTPTPEPEDRGICGPTSLVLIGMAPLVSRRFLALVIGQ